jgi:hypothetical protein
MPFLTVCSKPRLRRKGRLKSDIRGGFRDHSSKAFGQNAWRYRGVEGYLEQS